MDSLQRKYLLKKELNIRKCRNSFYEFCKYREPDFYKPDRYHLKVICNTLQDIYEGKLINPKTNEPYKNMMLNVPPRHGKSRTLTNFTAWCLGNDNTNMIMTISYNEESASEFSRFTRDMIMEDTAVGPLSYQDIFPDTRIKRGNSAAGKWALEGYFFNYLGSSFNGSVTGKGCRIMIIDDPVKNAYEALNQTILNQIYDKYVNTMLSRVEKGGIKIVCMTRWSGNDLCGRILNTNQGDDWYVLKLPAYDSETNEMLCEDILGIQEFNVLKESMDPLIFYSNYMQQEINVKDALYTGFQTYTAKPEFEKIVSYTDTADTGSDYLTTWIAGLKDKELYILDLVYTQEPMEKTEPMVAETLYSNNTNIAVFESNNGGRLFANNVEKRLKEKYNTNRTIIKSIPQTKNKETRILMHATWICQHVYFPEGFRNKYPKAYKDLINYSRSGKNVHDDIQDALTGLAEHFVTEEKKQFRIRTL